MQSLSPDGPVYQAGTLSGNPLAMAAGIATLRALQDGGVYEKLEQTTAQLCDGLHDVFEKHSVPHQTYRRGSMFCTFFTSQPVYDLETATQSDTQFYGKFFHAMLKRGVYFAPAQFEAGFVSTAHTSQDIEHTIAAADDALVQLFTAVP
jgi:glutamate-1-semialdehyde 2,1-aminomutase